MEVPDTSNNINIPEDQEPQPPCRPCVTHVIMQKTFQPKRKWSIREHSRTRVDCKNNFDSESHTPSVSVTKTI